MQRGVMIVGGVGGTNVGDSLARAGAEQGRRITLVNHADAMSRLRVVQSLMWRLAGKRPLYLNRFSRRISAGVCRGDIEILIATGPAPLNRSTLDTLRAKGVFCINYSTDDPWNPVHRAVWFLRSLSRYNVVFTPRRSNMADFHKLGCGDVRYLPFGYAPDLFRPPGFDETGTEPRHEVLFVGGADSDRLAFFTAFLKEGLRNGTGGLRLGLAGDYWHKFPETRALAVGHLDPRELCRLTASAAVNLCLVRRANRDGHVMRSFEIPAVGGFMIAEDTQEHRDLFGFEGDNVLYFTSPEDAVKKTRWALERPTERIRMARAAKLLITNGRHTYADRLNEMIAISALS
jgi:spore maturation protein CgeB